MKKNRRNCFVPSALNFHWVMILMAAVANAPAASRTWDGGGTDNFWQAGANWVGNTPPSDSDDLVFQGTARLGNTNNFVAGTLFNGITFNSPAGAFSLWGNAITLGGNITNSQTLVTETINLSLALNATRTVSVVSDGSLILSGSVSGAGSGLVNTGGGLLSLTASNSFSGPVSIFAGTLSVASDSNLGAVPSSPSAGRIVIDGGALRSTASFTLSSNRGIALGAGKFNITSGTTLSYGGTIANGGTPGSLTKISFGALTLSGANTYTGPTLIKNGTVNLDFSPASAPLNNIISSSSFLSLGGETAGLGTASYAALNMSAGAGKTNSQTFNGTSIEIGPAIIRATNSTANLALGALTHTPGGVVNFVTPAAVGTGGSTTTTTPNTHGILGGWATVGAGGIFNNITMGTDWASVDATGNIVAYTNYLIFPTGGTLQGLVSDSTNLRINSASTGDVIVNTPAAGTTTDVNTINLSETRAFTINIGANNTLRLGKYGSVYKSDNANNITWAMGSSVGGANGVQDEGSLTAGGAPDTPGEIVFYMNNGTSQSAGSLNVETRITDNGTGAVTVVKAGPSSMKLRGHNTFSGGLYLLQGRLQLAGGEIGTANPDGAGSGIVVVMPGAYLFPSGTGSILTNTFYIAGVGTQQEPVGAIRFGNGWSISGDINLLGDTRLGGGNAGTVATTGVGGKISGAFNLDVGARQTINSFISLSNPSNDWSGTTTLNARNTATANTFRNGASEVIPHGVGKGNLVMDGNSNTGTITWDLSGFNETVNGLHAVGFLAGCIIENRVDLTTSTLTIGDYDQSATFGGVIQNGAAGGGIVSVRKIGGGSQTFSGANTFTGRTLVEGGTLALIGSGSISASSETLVNDATLDVSGVAGGLTTTGPIGLSNGVLVVRSTGSPGLAALSVTNSRIQATTLGATPVETTGLTTSGATNFIDVLSVGTITSYPTQFTVIKYSGSIGGAGFNFGLGNVPSISTIGYVSNNAANSSIDVYLIDGPKPLTWTGQAGSAWDIGTTTNWVAFGVTPVAFLNADSAFFFDTASTNIVDLTTTLLPDAVVVSNSTLNYTFVGNGNLSGLGTLVKDGSGTLTLANSGINDFRGGITINAGTVQVGTNSTTGNLPAGSLVNNASLVFNRSDNLTVTTDISGTGTVLKNGSGTLTLSGANTFDGSMVIAEGIIKAENNSAFGNEAGTTTVSLGAMLDVNGRNLGNEPVIVSGTGVGGLGAIINSGADSLNALRNVTLAGNTTFGGSGRWDIRESSTGAGDANLVSGNNPYTLTKIGSNQVSLVGVSVDALLGDIIVAQGMFSVETVTTSLGNPANSLTVSNGATLQFFNTSAAFDKRFILNGDGVTTTVNNNSGNNTIGGPVTLNGSNIFNAGGTSLTLSGAVGGSGNLRKTGGAQLILSGNNNYSGPTVISAGTLTVDGNNLGAGTVTAAGGTLGGIGSIASPVSIESNGSLSPGNVNTPEGTLAIRNALTLAGNTVIDVFKSGGVFLNDTLTNITALTLGGSLQVNLNISSEPLAAGDVIKLFSANSASGSFAQLTPATPGPGLQWDTTQLTVDGTLRVRVEILAPSISSVTRSGNDLVFSGSGGTANAAYSIITSTNIVLPLSSWTPIATNSFDGAGNFSVTNAIGGTIPQRFFTIRIP